MGTKIEAELLNFRQGATLLGISIRSFHQLRAEPWFPAPLELGPRLLRWRRAELLEALATRAPRQTQRTEPAQLAGSRSTDANGPALGMAPRAQRAPATA